MPLYHFQEWLFFTLRLRNKSITAIVVKTDFLNSAKKRSPNSQLAPSKVSGLGTRLWLLGPLVQWPRQLPDLVLRPGLFNLSKLKTVKVKNLYLY